VENYTTLTNIPGYSKRRCWAGASQQPYRMLKFLSR
jgi:hypothetical protein